MTASTPRYKRLTPTLFLIAIASVGANKDGWASLGWIEVR